MKRPLSAFLAVAAVGALVAAVPAGASASELRVSPATKVKLAPLETKGWAYYCPSSHPYVKYVWDETKRRPVLTGVDFDSDKGVISTVNGWHTDPRIGKLTVTYTNLNWWGANGHVRYTCSDVKPPTHAP